MNNDNAAIMSFNALGVAVAYGMLALSLYLSSEVPLATKDFWGMGILLLTLSLVNFVRYRIDERHAADRMTRIENARNEKLLSEFAED